MRNRAASDSGDRNGIRKEMREFHRVHMLILWLTLGVFGAVSLAVWATLYFSGQLAQ